MARLYNLARMHTATVGGASLIDLGAAVTGFLSFANAGVTDGTTVSYAINDPRGGGSEVGSGVYHTGSPPTFTRTTVEKSSDGTNRISLSLHAEIMITPSAADLNVVYDVLSNRRLAKTANYTVLNADKGKTIALGGSAFFTLTFSAASGYDDEFMVLVVNEDTGRAKNVAISGGVTFRLYPGQTACVFNQNDAWQTIRDKRWRINPTTHPSGLSVYGGAAYGGAAYADTDGLAAGAAAFSTMQAALDMMCNDLEATGGVQVRAQLAAATTTENLKVFTYFATGEEATQSDFVITGDSSSLANAANYVLGCGSGIGVSAVGLASRWRLTGFTIQGTDATHGTCVQSDFGSSKIYISSNMRFGAAQIHRAAINGGKIEQLAAPIEIFGSAQTSILVSGPGSAYLEQNGAAVTFTNALSWSSSYLAVADGGGYLARGTTKSGTTPTGVRWQTDSFSCIDVLAGSQGVETAIETALTSYGGTAGGYQLMTGTGSDVRANGATLTSPVLAGGSADTINLTGGQIVFPATQAPSAGANTLDDYEEGTWTPALTFATPGDLAVVLSTATGFYTKIGRQVTAWFNIQSTTFTHTTASGNLRITGLPFAGGSTYRGGNLAWVGITKANYTQLCPSVISGQTYFEIHASGSGQAFASIATGDAPTATNYTYLGSVTYNV